MTQPAQSTDPVYAEQLRAALEEANLPTLLLALVQLTGDEGWLTERYPPSAARGPGDHDSAGLSPEAQAALREEAHQTLIAVRDGAVSPAPAPATDRLGELLSLSLAEPIPEGYGPLLAEEIGLADRHVALERIPSKTEMHVLVIGAGVSGLLAAIQLSTARIPFTVLEKDPALGGTWFENTYPGAGVDTPTHLYSLSFAQRPQWSRYFAKQPEIHEYLDAVARAHGVTDQVRYGWEVTAASWDEAAQRWRVTARDPDGAEQTLTANVLISGTGFFNRPALPPIPGIGDFDGIEVHTAQWSPEVPVAGQRIGVIGTGASAMQLVPTIAGTADRVVIFQRTPQWGLPHPNYLRDTSPGVRFLMAEVPHYMEWYRARLVWTFGDRLHANVQQDPDWPHPERAINQANDRMRGFLTEYIKTELGERQDLFADCLPSYPPFGKRPLLDNGWFASVARDDVELVTADITQIDSGGVLTADGVHHDLDVIVYATGFKPQQLLSPITITGRGGGRLHDVWGDDDARAYLGLSMPGFPNLFCLLGPNTFAGHGGSGIFTIECEMRYVMEMLKLMLEGDIASVDCLAEVHDSYNRELDEALSHTIWAHPGMSTYYRNSAGRIVVPMPWTNVDYWHRTRMPDLTDYELTQVGTAQVGTAQVGTAPDAGSA